MPGSAAREVIGAEHIYFPQPFHILRLGGQNGADMADTRVVDEHIAATAFLSDCANGGNAGRLITYIEHE